MRQRQIVRVYGPPGTGKTSWIAREIEQLISQGANPNAIFVVSFSRAAAQEITKRISQAIPEENLGTIHSLAYRQLNYPELALSSKAIRQWNSTVHPQWQLTPQSVSTEDALLDSYNGEDDVGGNHIYGRVVLLRNKRIPLSQWSPSELAFWERFRAWMRQDDLVDFPAMLERALSLTGLRADYLFVDEAQDLTPLQLALTEHWAIGTRLTAYVGDDDQAIYSYMGADGMGFRNIAVDREIILDQSWRVPAAVQALANRIIARVSSRAEKSYRPRAEPGELNYWPEPPHRSDRLIQRALEHISAGESVLFLATASYLLEPLRRELSFRGIPYGNPYAPNRAAFNTFPRRDGADWMRIAAFLSPNQLGRDVKKWLPLLDQSAFLRPDATRLIRNLDDDENVSSPEHRVWNLLREPHRCEAIQRNPRWLRFNVSGNVPRGVSEALAVAVNAPEAVLAGTFDIQIGTIHSVKGGEADRVFIWPGYSRAAGEAPMDNLHRLFYVGVTRARRGVYLLGAGGAAHAHYEWPWRV